MILKNKIYTLLLSIFVLTSCTSVPIYQKCDGGDGKACFDLAKEADKNQQGDIFFTTLKRSCDLGFDDGCKALTGAREQLEKGRQACENGTGAACHWYAVGEGSQGNEEQAKNYLERGCKLKYSPSCKGIKLLEASDKCKKDSDGKACYQYALFFEESKSYDSMMAALNRGCELENTASCTKLKGIQEREKEERSLAIQERALEQQRAQQRDQNL